MGSGNAVPAIGRALGADAVLGGSVSRLSNRIRLNLHLTEVATGQVLWSGNFERNAREVLVLQADAVRGLANGIRADLRPDVRERLTTVRAISPDVYEAYLKGLYAWNQKTARLHAGGGRGVHPCAGVGSDLRAGARGARRLLQPLGHVLIGTGSPREYRPKASWLRLRATGS